MVGNATDKSLEGTEGLLTKLEVAGILRVRPKTIERFMAQRELPYIKIGRLVRFERAGVEEFKRRLTVPASAAPKPDGTD
ncbi:helix-turn-helix domain-containing protein [Verrucomicrobium sp. BvORR034]|jgi:excisionase family DNA binding protein|uniref:helix-turn-helix domain-containing protein n=1 Tax=Verrucomicrobium sp. BvORR034 TaxID=1396418 RepID=UPI0006792705|nr:helix-turn-helix domain-containing protein [Verrucomicrobium sp. BvORR034]